MRKNKFKKYIFLLIIPLLFITGISSWIILNNTVFAPSYNPNSTSILFQAFDGQSGTYTKESQGPVSSNDKIKNENVSFSYRKADSNDFYTGGLPINAGTYDILIKDNSKYYVDEVVRYTINKADLSSVDISKLTIMPNVSPLVYGDILEYLGEATATGIKDDSSVPGDVYFYEGETETTSYKLTHAESTTTQVFDKSIKMIFSPSDNYSVNYNSIEFNINVEMSAVAYTGTSNKKYYSTIQNAITSLSGASGTVYVIPNLGFEIINDANIEIPSGITVSMPYEGTSIKISEEEILEMPNTYADENTTNRVTLIKFENNSDIIINQGGTLKIGGQTGPIGVAGKYVELNLDVESSVICEGTIECYGYIKEKATDSPKNGLNSNFSNYYDNSYDSGRFVNIKSTGKIITQISMYDMKGISALTSLNDSGIFPLNIFDFPCIQTYMQIDSGGTLTSYTFLNAQGVTVHKEIVVISSSSSMFNLKSGNMAIEYCPNNINVTSTNSLTRVFINGELEQGTASLNISGMNITTDNKFLPLSYKFHIYINNNGKYTTNYKVKILPGGKFKINTGGEAILNNEFICYSGTDSSKIASYPNNNDSLFFNDGKLTIGTSGKIGAFIQTEAIDNSALLDFSNCVDDSVFTVATIEGQNQETITKTSEGYFADNSSEGKSIYQFVAGSKVLSDSAGNKCWNGTKYALRNIKLTMNDSSITNPIFSFEINVKDELNSSTYTTISTGDQSSLTNSFEVADGKYVNINIKRHKSAIFSNGSSFNSSEWYLVSDDMEILITPNSGVIIKIVTTMDSGNARTSFTLSECDSENGTFYEIGTWEGIANPPEVSVLVVKNWYFKITYSDGKDIPIVGEGYKSKLDPDNFTITSLTNSNATSSKFVANKATFADDSYEVYFPRKEASCITSGTLLTLADGTQKKVEDLLDTDMLLVFNHETGKFEAAPIIFVDRDEWKNYNIVNLEFSNGTKTRLIYEHGYFNLTLNKYVYITESNYQDYIGHEFAFYDGNKVNSVTLTKSYITNEYVGCYSPVTAYHLNYIVDGYISMPGGIEGLFNIFEYNDDMTYDIEKMNEDIEKYGLYTYEDFKDYLPYEVYLAFPGPYLKVSVEKGYITFEEIIGYIEQYLGRHGLDK